jgi:nucleotide-binding universal stress UspA family protein
MNGRMETMTDRTETPFPVLVPLDGSTLALQAVPYAEALARNGGEIVLATVLPPLQPHSDERGWRMTMTEQDQERALDDARSKLREIAKDWLRGVARVHVDAQFGEPAEEILKMARRHNVRVIVLASHGRGALGRLRFGSVADRLTRSSETPVLVIRPLDAEPEMAHGRIRRFVVALDNSERAEAAIPIVEEIARRTGDSIHLVSVVETPEAIILPVPWMGPPVAQPDLESGFEATHRRATERLGQLAAQLTEAGIETTWSVEAGDPFEEIDELAAQHDVIALTTHGRSGLERWALGSLAEKLIRNAKAPVLVINTRSASAR